MQEKQKNNNLLRKMLFIVVYLICVFVIAKVNILEISIAFGRHKLDISDISVVITMFLTIWIIVHLITLKEIAYRISHILFAIHFFVVVLGIIMTQSIKTVPALMSIVFMLVISTIVFCYIKTIESKENEMHKLAYIDAMTNTPNRSAFNELIFELTAKGMVNKKPFALVYIDINEFTSINDAAGHEFGNKVLIEIVSRWKYTMKSNDFIARVGGDEFALVIQDFENETDLLNHIEDFSNVLKNKITIDDQSIFVSASFGISIFPKDSTNAEELLRFADIAMQVAYELSGISVMLFEPKMIEKVENELNVENLLRDAISNDRFKLVFQPQYDTETKKLRGFETLLRMNDEQGKPISPGIFIPIAERKGLIIDIECIVLKNAMESFLPIIQKFDKNLILSVNISAVHLVKNSFINDVKTALEKTNFPPENLELEITESVFIASLDSTAYTLNQIKKMGVKIALDDFGTGYASLSYLTKLPIDLLKIDKTFVDGLQQENNLADFVAAIISMGHLLHFDVISEGVEHETQLDTLRQFKCDFIQGFVWGKPMDISSVKELLEKTN